MAEDRIVLDPRTLRGLAHPLRVKLLNLLREQGPSTATRLADLLGLTSGATSYHLRQLALYGFVVEESGQGTGRERWWRAAHRTTTLEEFSPEAMPETETYLRSVAAFYFERVERAIGEIHTMPPEWLRTSTLSDRRLRLTPAEAMRLHEEVFELMDRYRRDGPDADAPPDAEQVVIQVQLIPLLGTPHDDSGAAS